MSSSRRFSYSSVRNQEVSLAASNSTNLESVDSSDWIKSWENTYAKGLIDSRVVCIDAHSTVEEACDLLLSEDILCLAIQSQTTEPSATEYLGLFDFSDVNAFLTLAATRHTFSPEDPRGNVRAQQIVAAAKAGRVPVHLVSNLSQKNPLEILPGDSTIISLLTLFSKGIHRVLVKSSSEPNEFLGMVSDRGLLAWISSYAQTTPSFLQFLSNPIQSLSLPSLNICSAVVSTMSSAKVLDAMKLMSEEGVSSVAVIDEETGRLISAVSVTDIGNVVVPSQSNQILSAPLQQFISLIKKYPQGSEDGVDNYPVYSVLPSSPLSYTIEKLLATNAHRLFVTRDPISGSPSISPGLTNNLSGIVSIVDILSLCARVARIPDVDPRRLSRHRRASSSSSHSSRSDVESSRSRSHSRASTRQSPRAQIASPGRVSTGDSARNSVSSIESFKWADRVPK